MNSEEKEKPKDENPPPDSESSAISPSAQPKMIFVAAPMPGNYGYGGGFGFGNGFQPPVHTPAKRGCYKESGECCCGFSRTCCICTWVSVAISIVITCTVLAIVLRFVAWKLYDDRESESDAKIRCCWGNSSDESKTTTQLQSAKALCKGGHKREDPNCKDGAACKIITFWGAWQTSEYTPQKDCYNFPVVTGSKNSEFENGTCQCSTGFCNCPPRLRPSRRSRARKMRKKAMKKYFRFPMNILYRIPIASDILSYTFYYVFPN